MQKVSIVIPIFNAEYTIKKCIESVLNQTYTNIELILINDGSSDNSLSICNEFLYDERVSIICQGNLGVSAARNAGIDYSTGDWIMFVDADDSIDSEMIFFMIKNLNEQIQGERQLDLVFCGFQKDYYDNKLSGNIIKSNSYYCDNRIMDKEQFCLDIESYLQKCLIQGPCGKLFNRRIIEDNNIRFNEKLSYGEDTLFVYTYLKYTSNISCLNGTFYHYNVYNHDSLNMSFRRDKLKIHIMLNHALEDLIKDYNIYSYELTNKMLVAAYVSFCGDLCGRDISDKTIFDCLNEINSYNEVIAAFQSASDSLQNRIIRVCIQRELYRTEIRYFKIKEKIRKNERLYNFLLRRDNIDYR